MLHGVFHGVGRAGAGAVAVADAVGGAVHQLPVPQQEDAFSCLLADIDGLVAVEEDPVLPAAQVKVPVICLPPVGIRQDGDDLDLVVLVGTSM